MELGIIETGINRRVSMIPPYFSRANFSQPNIRISTNKSDFGVPKVLMVGGPHILIDISLFPEENYRDTRWSSVICWLLLAHAAQNSSIL